MQLTIARNLQELDALADAWQCLEQEVPNTLPFQTFTWTSAWWQAFRVDSARRKDALEVLFFWEAQKLVAVIPYVISRFQIFGRSVFTYIRPIGADPNLTEIRLPLCLQPFQKQVIGECLDYLASISEGIGMHSIIAAKDDLRSFAKVGPMDTKLTHYYVLPLAESWEAFRKNLKRNIKESLRRCYNSLARDGLKATLHVLSESVDILGSLEAYYALHGARSEAQSTVSHPNYFENPRHRAFLALLATDAKRLGMKMFCLQVNGETVAMRIGYVVNTELYLYYSGYRPDFAKYSVMTTLVAEMLAWAHAQGLARVNLSTGNDVSKTRWGPEMMTFATQHHAKNAWATRLIAGWALNFQGAKTTYRRIKVQ